MPKYSFWVLKYYFDFFQPLKNYKNPILVLRQYKNRWWAEFDLWGTVCQHVLWPKSHYQYLLYTRQRSCLAFPSLYPKLPLPAPQTVLLTFTSMPLKCCCTILLLLYFFNFSSAMFQQILAVQRGFLGYTILSFWERLVNECFTHPDKHSYITPHVIHYPLLLLLRQYPLPIAVVVEAIPITHCCCCCCCCWGTKSSLPICDPMDCSTPGTSIRGISQAKNTGVGCHFLLQGIFPVPGSNTHLLHLQVDSLPLATGEAHITCCCCSTSCSAVFAFEFSRQEYWRGQAFPSPRGSSWPRDRTQVSHIATRLFLFWATREVIYNMFWPHKQVFLPKWPIPKSTQSLYFLYVPDSS